MGIEHVSWQGSVGADVDILQAALQAVEQACAALQIPSSRAAAEATLLAFQKSQQPIQTCQYILEHSQMANARFQAAATVQDAAIREWGFFTADEKSNLRTYCLRYVMARAEAPEAYVQSKVSAVAAVLMKRGWLEMVATEKDAFFNEVQQAISGIHGPAAQKSGIAFIESLVSEFSPSTASAIGLSAEFHEHCRASLELDYLQKFYTWAQDAAMRVVDRIFQGLGSVLEVHVCSSALHLMSQILSWDFHGSLVRVAGGVIVVGKNRANAFSTSRENVVGKRIGEHGNFVQPGQGWQELLLSPSHISWLRQLYTHMRQHSSGSTNMWIKSSLTVSTRQIIVQLCSLSGSIFLADGGNTHEQHLQQLLPGIMAWINPPEAVISSIKSGSSESEMLDGCRALLSIASLTSPSTFDQLLKPNTSTLNLLASLTQEVIKASREIHDEEQTWADEALEILLDTWSVLLQPADLSKRIPFPLSGTEAAAAVFDTFVDIELKAAAASAFDEGDDTEQLQAAVAARDDRLSALALIARAAPLTSVPRLAMLVSERCSFLYQCKGGQVDATSVLEELHWLLLISGHVLADSSDGETPMVPEAIVQQLVFIGDESSHPVVLLSRSAISLAQQTLDHTLHGKIFSSRLFEAVVWFFARWVDTYLMPADAGRGPSCTPSGQEGDQHHFTVTGTHYDGRNALMRAFGEQGDGKSVLETLVRVAITSLTSWPGERNLQEITCFQLLPALVRRRNICVHLVAMETWQELAKAFAYHDQRLSALAAPIQRALSENLCRSATGMSTGDGTNQYVKDLIGPIATTLSDISKRNDLKTFSQQPNAIFMVCSLVERLRGAARATMPRSQKAIFEIGTAVMEALLTFLETYKNQSGVVYILLKYVVDWVDGQVAFLEAKDTAILFNFCVRLLQIYSAHNIGKVSVSKSQNLLNESQAEKYKDLRALLQLLTNLSSKDLIDFASDGNGEEENPDVAQMVYLGLHIIMPLISADLLKYPKLCRQYFTLLAHMLEVYPEKVAKLSPEVFGSILSTLDFGLRHQDVEVVNMTLTAMNATAFYHYQSICRGHEGLGMHTLSTQASMGIVHEGVLSHFLRSLMQFLLFEDYSNELIDPAADALLPLILCNTALYQSLVQELLQKQQNVLLQSRLATGFHMLINANQVTSSLDRANRRKFRENLYIFLADVRGFLRTR